MQQWREVRYSEFFLRFIDVCDSLIVSCFIKSVFFYCICCLVCYRFVEIFFEWWIVFLCKILVYRFFDVFRGVDDVDILCFSSVFFVCEVVVIFFDYQWLVYFRELYCEVVGFRLLFFYVCLLFYIYVDINLVFSCIQFYIEFV